MGEGLLGGIVGDEDEKPEVEASEALAGVQAFAAAIAAKLSGNDPQVAKDTSAFLKKQAQLLETQNKHFEEEHVLRVAHLRNQLSEETVRGLGLRLRVGFQIFIALLATAIALGLIIMVRDAVTSRSVVIDAFDVAPNATAQVPSGKIVAAGLLDVLTQIQATNQTNAEHRSLSNAWTGDIAIEVPETGVSLGQVERILKTRFGNDLHIEGDVVQTEKGGLALTVRGTKVLPKTFADEGRNIDRLLTQAGEYVYAEAQPGLWASYLVSNGRVEEAITFSQSAYLKADQGERPYILNAWGNALATTGGEAGMRKALPLYRESVRLNPTYWVGYNNVMNALAALGDEEDVIRVAEQMRKAAGGRPGRAPDNLYENYDVELGDLQTVHAGIVADMESHAGIGTIGSGVGAANLAVAAIEVLLHDPEAAKLRLQLAVIDDKNTPDVALAAFSRALLAEQVSDFAAAAKQWDIFAMAYTNPTVASNNPTLICSAALTYQRAGQPAKADAALGAVGTLTFVDCFRFRGDVLELRGDWTGAQEWYATAVKLGPSIPSGYYSWGVALAKHGDLVGAESKLKDANQRGPHWADPLKAWGDVLVKQSKTQEALAKYEEALKYAPNWKELKEARETLVKQKA